MGLCGKCDKTVIRTDSESLQCTGCKKLYHGICLGLKDQDLQKCKTNVLWTCPSCETSEADAATRKVLLRKSSLSCDSNKETEVSQLSADVKDVKIKVGECALKMDVFLAKLDNILGEMTLMRRDHVNLSARVDVLEQKVQDINVSNDTKEIEIRGPQNLQEAEKYNSVISICQNALGITIGLHDIDECYIIKNRPKVGSQTGSLTESLIVKLTTGRVRDEIINSWRIRRTNDGVSCIFGGAAMKLMFRERLSRASKAVLDATKEYAKKAGWKYVWVKRGRIYIRKADGERAHWVRSTAQLSGFK